MIFAIESKKTFDKISLHRHFNKVYDLTEEILSASAAEIPRDTTHAHSWSFYYAHSAITTE